MKKITALLLALVMLVSLAACSLSSKPGEAETEAPDGASSQIVNPITEYTSLDELNKAVGAKFTHPGVMGVTDESFCTIANGNYTIGQYKFSVNGNELTMRFANNTTEDISGIYVGDATIFAGTQGEQTVVSDEYIAGRWFNIDGQYVLSAPASVGEEWFDNAYDELKDLTAPQGSSADFAAFYASIDGDYQDKVSQRASAEVDNEDGKYVEIEVEWAESAFVTNEWKMTATKTEDGLLSYKDCKHIKVDYTNSEDGVETVESENGEGYFSIDENNNLVWNGAADDYCTECVFEKIPDID